MAVPYTVEAATAVDSPATVLKGILANRPQLSESRLRQWLDSLVRQRWISPAQVVGLRLAVQHQSPCETPGRIEAAQSSFDAQSQTLQVALCDLARFGAEGQGADIVGQYLFYHELSHALFSPGDLLASLEPLADRTNERARLPTRLNRKETVLLEEMHGDVFALALLAQMRGGEVAAFARQLFQVREAEFTAAGQRLAQQARSQYGEHHTSTALRYFVKQLNAGQHGKGLATDGLKALVLEAVWRGFREEQMAQLEARLNLAWVDDIPLAKRKALANTLLSMVVRQEVVREGLRFNEVTTWVMPESMLDRVPEATQQSRIGLQYFIQDEQRYVALTLPSENEKKQEHHAPAKRD